MLWWRLPARRPAEPLHRETEAGAVERELVDRAVFPADGVRVGLRPAGEQRREIDRGGVRACARADRAGARGSAHAAAA
jgi:hypothetical protein